MEISKSSNRRHHIDKSFDSDKSNVDFSNSLFVRLIAKGKKFDKVDFKYTIFDTCYLRNCVFVSCNFTGCRFIGVNFYGTSFDGCTFDYATFEKTIVDNDILYSSCPSWDNLKLKFARTLRTNYQQIGDSKSANKAIRIELDATKSHLNKAWNSNESYYRNKYKQWNRVKVFLEWVNFVVLDFIWGNGENIFKLIRSTLLLMLLMSFADSFVFSNVSKISSYWNSLLKMPEVFLGISTPTNYPNKYLALISFVRLTTMGFFMSIIIKRFNRR